MDLVDDFAWENYGSWDGSEPCYSRLKDLIRAATKRCSMHKLKLHALEREQEQKNVLEKLRVMQKYYVFRDAFDQFITQRERLCRVYFILALWFTSDIVL